MRIGHFIGQKNLPLQNFEVAMIENLLNTKYDNDYYFIITLYDKPKTYRDSNKNLIKNLSKIKVHIRKQLGWFNANNEIIIDKQKQYDCIQYDAFITTDATVREYRCKKFYRYEPKKHYDYNTDLKELLLNIKQDIISKI